MSHDHSHCHDEHHAHGGDDHHDHDHTDDLTPALQNLLYEQIDFSKLVTLNEDDSNSGRAICQKTWAQRLDNTPELRSSADEQLLMIVPFTGQVRLHSILLRTSPSPSCPKTLKVFLNADSMDFETASEKEPTQELSISQTSEVQEIPVKRAYFNTTRSLALFFEDNWSGGEEDETVLSYLAFKGDFMRLNKEPVSVLYEAAANPADHKSIVGIGEGVGRSIQ
ncbi:PITH domain-containing protein [Phaeosphaeria sp. MPI-PUGE-AT-0046c]|nr:PITH domain-containing protein [Phaeosphaeria sp. MPI-PUGE-AT-0046c]